MLRQFADVFAIARVERRTRARAEVTSRDSSLSRQGGTTRRGDAVESDAIDLLHECLDRAGRLLGDRRCLVSRERPFIVIGSLFLRAVAASRQFRHLCIGICGKRESVDTIRTNSGVVQMEICVGMAILFGRSHKITNCS